MVYGWDTGMVYGWYTAGIRTVYGGIRLGSWHGIRMVYGRYTVVYGWLPVICWFLRSKRRELRGDLHHQELGCNLKKVNLTFHNFFKFDLHVLSKGIGNLAELLYILRLENAEPGHPEI